MQETSYANGPRGRTSARVLLCALGLAFFASAQAGLLEDDEARKAILELRQRVEAVRQTADAQLAEQVRKSGEESAQLRRSLVDLQNQIEALRAELARLTGQGEQLQRSAAESQRRQSEALAGLEQRLRKLEPLRMTIDGKEVTVEPPERREFESALALFKKGDFAGSQPLFVEFIKRYSESGYRPSALFWLGNAQYATRDYKEAIVNFRALLTQSPEHMRVPETMLSIANCQLELKDARAARKTLEDLIKAHPQSEAAAAAKERLARLK
ncbi:MAG: tol-pal system protein YbgF [Betaproteobacteria bacterium]